MTDQPVQAVFGNEAFSAQPHRFEVSRHKKSMRHDGTRNRQQA